MKCHSASITGAGTALSFNFSRCGRGRFSRWLDGEKCAQSGKALLQGPHGSDLRHGETHQAFFLAGTMGIHYHAGCLMILPCSFPWTTP